MDVVLHRGLARLPSDRYPSCAEFVAALEEASKDTARPQPQVEAPTLLAARAGPDRAAAVSVRNLLAAGVVLLALLAGFLLYKVLYPNLPHPQQAATPALQKPAAPVVTQFTAAPQSIAAGSAATLRWDVTGATEVVLGPGLGKVAASAAFEVRPLKPTAYLLTATGPGGNVSAQAFVNVTPAPSALAPPAPAAPDNATRARKLYADAVAQRSAHQPAKALESFRQAANLGEAHAMVELGEALYGRQCRRCRRSKGSSPVVP